MRSSGCEEQLIILRPGLTNLASAELPKNPPTLPGTTRTDAVLFGGLCEDTARELAPRHIQLQDSPRAGHQDAVWVRRRHDRPRRLVQGDFRGLAGAGLEPAHLVLINVLEFVREWIKMSVRRSDCVKCPYEPPAGKIWTAKLETTTPKATCRAPVPMEAGPIRPRSTQTQTPTMRAAYHKVERLRLSVPDGRLP